MNKIIGIAGGSGSGKTTLAKKILDKFTTDRCVILSQDAYYIDQSAKFDTDGGSVNFDHPDSIDFTLLNKHIIQLRQNKTISVPQYDFKTHTRLKVVTTLAPRNLIVVEGTLLFFDTHVRENLDIKIYIDVPEEVRFRRRMKRDIEERGREQEGVRNQFFLQVKPMHDLYVEPTKKFANYILTEDEYSKCLDYLNIMI